MSADTSNISDHLLPVTAEEQDLLDLYAQVKLFEKEAALAKAEAAKAKLVAANEEFQREKDQHAFSESTAITNDIPKPSSSKKKKRSKRKREEISNEMDDEHMRSSEEESSQDEDELTDTDDEDKRTFRRNEAKIAQLREENDLAVQRQEKGQASAKAEEELRKQLLEGNQDTVDVAGLGPSLKKKRFDDESGAQRKETSLISKMNYVSTPPHDFSKSLSMSKITGKQLFPETNVAVTPEEKIWSPPDDATGPEDGCLELKLTDFNGAKAAVGQGNNTVAIKFTAPSESKRFSINIAEPNHENYYSVLFHFNPRQFERGGQVVINDKKAGMWGQGINLPTSQMPLIFGEVSCTLVVQINGDGFDVFMNGQHCARLEHRTPLPDKPKSLILQLPSTDDYSNRENWSVHKIWWGHKASMASKDLANVAGVNSHNAVHEKKLFVSGLPRIYLQPEVDLRRAELERAFRKYGGQEGAIVICPPNSTFAFVEVETERAADLALREMGNKYRLNRARRSRHEALLEQRAATEAEASGIEKETTKWD
eukprot:scaffold1862_cov268-Chaetoceros_neogracile.AAC.24